jgi:hypothetical protein
LVLFFVSEDARRCVDLIFKKGENLLPGHKKLKDMCVWVKVNALLWNKTFTLKRSLEINDTKFFFCTCNAFKKKKLQVEVLLKMLPTNFTPVGF